MALASYYDRAAIAASQVIAGFDAEVFRTASQDLSVGIAFSDKAAASPEGRAGLDLAVRLLARLYPSLCIRATGTGTEALAAELSGLALAINPDIALSESATVGISLGLDSPSWEQSVYVGCDAWVGRISLATALSVGASNSPYGAGAAVCLAASAIFRILLDSSASQPEAAELSCLDGTNLIQIDGPSKNGWPIPARTVLVGAGAIGQAATWALSRSPLQGTVHIVDHEPIDLSNLQRYLLGTPADVGALKASFAAEYLDRHQKGMGGQLRAVPVNHDWVQALAEIGHHWDIALAAVDSASIRRAIQAALPLWTANAWTQPGDLGVSDHDFIAGACIACLYLPTGATRNEDEIIATALGIPEQVNMVRALLYLGQPPPPELLQLIASRLAVDEDLLVDFSTRGIRDLYVQGICGGAVLPLRSGPVGVDVHVPLAHQSALAGILLAARLTRRAAGVELAGTEITRLDIRTDPPARPTQLASKDPRGLCLCQDSDYVAAYSYRAPRQKQSPKAKAGSQKVVTDD
jgi:hypothetical protein